MRLRLSNWLALGFIAFITAIFLLLGIAAESYFQQRHRDTAAHDFEQRAELAASIIAPSLTAANAQPPDLARQINAATGDDVTIFARDGSVIADSRATNPVNQGNQPEVASALAGDTVALERSIDGNDVRSWFAATPVRDGSRIAAVVRLAETPAQFDARVPNERNLIVLTLFVAEITVLLSALLFARLATRPLDKIVEMTRKVSRGDLTARAPDSQRSEFTEVAVAFNEMADELESTFEAIDLERKRLESVVEHLADGIVIVDADGRVVLMNLAAEKLLGLTRSRSIGRTYAEVLRDYELAAIVR